MSTLMVQTPRCTTQDNNNPELPRLYIRLHRAYCRRVADRIPKRPPAMVLWNIDIEQPSKRTPRHTAANHRGKGQVYSIVVKSSHSPPAGDSMCWGVVWLKRCVDSTMPCEYRSLLWNISSSHSTYPAIPQQSSTNPSSNPEPWSRQKDWPWTQHMWFYFYPH